MPGHDQTTSNGSGSVFSAEDGDGRRFHTHTQAEEQSSDKELFPGLGQRTANGSQSTEDGGREDGTSAAEVVVERIGQPAAQNGTGNVRGPVLQSAPGAEGARGTGRRVLRVDHTDQPLVPGLMRTGLGDTQRIGEGQVSTVGTSLVPSPRRIVG